MSRHVKLLAAVVGVSLLAFIIAGNLHAKGPKPKTAKYTIQGHVCSGEGSDVDNSWICDVDLESNEDAVDIGVNAAGWVEVSQLHVSGRVLCQGHTDQEEECIPIGGELSSGAYWGRARLLDHRFDFEFDVPGRTPCTLVSWDTPFPILDPDTTEYCRYGLVFGKLDHRTARKHHLRRNGGRRRHGVRRSRSGIAHG